MNDRVIASGFMAQNVSEDTHPLDRVFVRDLVLDCEIGVFENEHGVAQRVKFDVELHVRRHAAHLDDDIDKVISYDMIIDGIKNILSQGHIRLVETLAERIAQHCLSDPRAVRAIVRIEKLDKEPGAVGVEITRQARPPEAANVYQLWRNAAE